MIDRYYERHHRRPQGVAADNTYGNGELLQWLDDRGITPYIRVKECPNPTPDLYGIEKFTYVPEENCYLCGTEEPDRTASLEIATDAVCTRAVLPGGYGTKSQTTGALPQLQPNPADCNRMNVTQRK